MTFLRRTSLLDWLDPLAATKLPGDPIEEGEQLARHDERELRRMEAERLDDEVRGRWLKWLAP